MGANTRRALFPRRPQPKEKPRFAPPHCTQTIRASALGRERLHEGRFLRAAGGADCGGATRRGGECGDGMGRTVSVDSGRVSTTATPSDTSSYAGL